MYNYNIKSEKTESSNILSNDTIKAVDYLFGLERCKFVALESDGIPTKAYKAAESITITEILNSLSKFGYIGLVPKSIGMWVFIKTDAFCKFKDPDGIYFDDINNCRQFWYVGTIHKSLNPYRCSADFDNKYSCCGRIIQQHEYIILTTTDLVKLAKKLINKQIFDANGTLIDPKHKAEIIKHHQKLPENHIKDRQRLYRDLTPKEMLMVMNKITERNLYPVTRALILEMAIREHKSIKSGELNQKYLYAVLDKFMSNIKESIKSLTAKQQKHIVENAYEFARRCYQIKRDPPKRHFDWINLYKQGYSITAIANKYGKQRSTVSVALDKYGAKNQSLCI